MIVVLAIIALIAVPIVLNIIEKSREGAAVSSARSYIKATEAYFVLSELDENKEMLKSNNKYNVTVSTVIEDRTYKAINNLVEIKGTKPNGSEDYIILGDTYQVVEAKLTINNYEILIEDDEVISITKNGKTEEIENIKLNMETSSIELNKTLQLIATVTGNDDKTVTWTSSDERVATVDSNGLVKGIKEGTITITVRTSNGKSATANISVLSTNLSNIVQVGDYVDYDAGVWTNSADIPTSQGQFGGYIKGENKANSINKECQKNEYAGTTNLKGFRVLKIENNQVYLVHAGKPECYYHESGYNNESITNLNNRAMSEYLNPTYATSAYNMKYEEAFAITGSEDVSTNTLRTTGAYYYLSSYKISDYLWHVAIGGRMHINGSCSYGIRPVIVLKEGIKTSGKTTDQVGQEAWSLVAP